jgi:hypothetical protein
MASWLMAFRPVTLQVLALSLSRDFHSRLTAVEYQCIVIKAQSHVILKNPINTIMACAIHET